MAFNRLIGRVSVSLLIGMIAVCGHAEDNANPSGVEVCTPIFAYMDRVEPDFAWKLNSTLDLGANKVHLLELTSQKWQNIVWKHSLIVYEPAEPVHKDHMLLFVTGGGIDSVGKTPKIGDLAMGIALANFSGARIATLHQVPNQPLMDGKKEDDLITETWLKYLETGDPTWPLLFPMAKSAVKAMDALEQFSEQQFKQPIKGFVITGASKRGWTSWLTSVVDKRIIATAPIVIDTLNFPKQMTHQKEVWGFYSEQIEDYTRKGLVHDDGIPRDGREAELWKMMDPFTYRSQLTMPKLLVVGANDRYWSVDAMSLYWDDLVGIKHIHRAPNGGHGLDAGKENALRTIAVFFRLAAAGKTFPEFSWKPEVTESEVGLTMTPSGSPQVVRLWVAQSDSNDFRESKWISQELPERNGSFSGHAEKTGEQRVAVFGEAEYEYEGVNYLLSTLVFWK
ncbi:MAG TPA: PhoPQ-activated protein PqaA family protein [Planctomycetaceae bacterium]|nr:PhoPQ-activated protein PqaA family protein [Planctomycetaceae bacterium]